MPSSPAIEFYRFNASREVYWHFHVEIQTIKDIEVMLTLTLGVHLIFEYGYSTS
jgi:hypothetical protein